MDEAFTKMVVKKLIELDRATRDLLKGQFGVPGLDIEHVRRIWPVLLFTSHGLLTSSLFSGLLDHRLPDGLFADARVGTTTIGDLGDYEPLLALAEAGEHTLPSLLAEYHASGFSQLPPRNWIYARFGGDIPRPEYVTRAYTATMEDMKRRLFPAGEKG